MNKTSIASQTKKDLALSGTVTAQTLDSGFSRAQVYLVTHETKKFVVRFFKSKTPQKVVQEITALQIASQLQYGPQLYFVDPHHEYIIMEFIPHQPFSNEDRHSNNILHAFGRMLKKIHTGPEFTAATNIMHTIYTKLQTFKEINEDYFPLEKIESIASNLESLLLPHFTIGPTHGDLHPRNLIFSNNEFKVIDLETAAQSDPYIDIATIAINYNLELSHEEIMLHEYFGRTPLPKERANLYFMKQLVLIHYALSLLKITSIDDWKKYADLQPKSCINFYKEIDWQVVDLKNSKSKLYCAKSIINHLLSAHRLLGNPN